MRKTYLLIILLTILLIPILACGSKSVVVVPADRVPKIIYLYRIAPETYKLVVKTAEGEKTYYLKETNKQEGEEALIVEGILLSKGYYYDLVNSLIDYKTKYEICEAKKRK